MIHLAHVLVRLGWGNISFLETFWLLMGLACLKDSACLFWDARAQLTAALAPPVDDTLRLLALMDHRSALQALFVQVCFVAVGLVAALRPPPPAPLTDDDALSEMATVAFFVAVQVAVLLGARERRRLTRAVDRELQETTRSKPLPGGRRWYDPKLPEPPP